MATHALIIDLNRCLGFGSCIASCEQLANNPPRIGLKKLGPFKAGDKPKIEFLHYPLGKCIDSPYCMEMFGREGVTPCVVNCPARAISIMALEELPKVVKDKESGKASYIQIFK